MPVNRSDVDHIAQLAHLALRPEEIEILSSQLSSVIDHVARLRELDTSGIEPTAYVAPGADSLREDDVSASWPAAMVLANAPRRQDDFFEVQAILD